MMKAVHPRVFDAFSAPASPKGNLPWTARTPPQDTFVLSPPAPAPQMPDHRRWVDAVHTQNRLEDKNGNRYEMSKYFGRGAYGTVYVARAYRPTGKKDLVCLKSMPQTKATVNEVGAMLACNSPLGPKNLMMVGHDCVFMEEALCDGNLAWAADQFAERHPELLEAFVLNTLKQVATQLQPLHEANIVHRDIKPANILYIATRAADDGTEKRGEIFAADFGRAMVEQDQPARVPGLATPGFTSPQAVTDPCTPADDLWALGATALMLLMGYTPFDPYLCLPQAEPSADKSSGIEMKTRRYHVEVKLLRGYVTWLRHNRPSKRLDDYFGEIAEFFPRVSMVLLNALLAPEGQDRGSCASLLRLLDKPGIALTSAEAEALHKAWEDIEMDPGVAVRKEVHGVDPRPLHRSRTYDGLAQLRTGYEVLAAH